MLQTGESAATASDVLTDLATGNGRVLSAAKLTVHSKRPAGSGCIAAKSKFQRRRLELSRSACIAEASDDGRPNRHRQALVLDTSVDLADGSFLASVGVNSLNSILVALNDKRKQNVLYNGDVQ